MPENGAGGIRPVRPHAAPYPLFVRRALRRCCRRSDQGAGQRLPRRCQHARCIAAGKRGRSVDQGGRGQHARRIAPRMSGRPVDNRGHGRHGRGTNLCLSSSIDDGGSTLRLLGWQTQSAAPPLGEPPRDHDRPDEADQPLDASTVHDRRVYGGWRTRPEPTVVLDLFREQSQRLLWRSGDAPANGPNKFLRLVPARGVRLVGICGSETDRLAEGFGPRLRIIPAGGRLRVAWGQGDAQGPSSAAPSWVEGPRPDLPSL